MISIREGEQTMHEDIYRRLARRMDAIPNGFSATESGVELRLLAKIFTPEEAALAAVMRLTRHTAAEIAARADVDADAANQTLKEMVRKGLILAKGSEDQLTFRLTWDYITPIFSIFIFTHVNYIIHPVY